MGMHAYGDQTVGRWNKKSMQWCMDHRRNWGNLVREAIGFNQWLFTKKKERPYARPALQRSSTYLYLASNSLLPWSCSTCSSRSSELGNSIEHFQHWIFGRSAFTFFTWYWSNFSYTGRRRDSYWRTLSDAIIPSIASSECWMCQPVYSTRKYFKLTHIMWISKFAGFEKLKYCLHDYTNACGRLRPLRMLGKGLTSVYVRCRP